MTQTLTHKSTSVHTQQTHTDADIYTDTDTHTQTHTHTRFSRVVCEVFEGESFLNISSIAQSECGQLE